MDRLPIPMARGKLPSAASLSFGQQYRESLKEKCLKIIKPADGCCNLLFVNGHGSFSTDPLRPGESRYFTVPENCIVIETSLLGQLCWSRMDIHCWRIGRFFDFLLPNFIQFGTSRGRDPKTDGNAWMDQIDTVFKESIMYPPGTNCPIRNYVGNEFTDYGEARTNPKDLKIVIGSFLFPLPPGMPKESPELDNHYTPLRTFDNTACVEGGTVMTRPDCTGVPRYGARNEVFCTQRNFLFNNPTHFITNKQYVDAINSRGACKYHIIFGRLCGSPTYASGQPSDPSEKARHAEACIQVAREIYQTQLNQIAELESEGMLFGQSLLKDESVLKFTTLTDDIDGTVRDKQIPVGMNTRGQPQIKIQLKESWTTRIFRGIGDTVKFFLGGRKRARQQGGEGSTKRKIGETASVNSKVVTRESIEGEEMEDDSMLDEVCLRRAGEYLQPPVPGFSGFPSFPGGSRRRRKGNRKTRRHLRR